MNNNQCQCLLHDEDRLPLFNAQKVQEFGRIAVISPHPDDESLGCGGLLALASRYNIPCTVVFVSDGSASHPNSVEVPPQALAETRKQEALRALDKLGLKQSQAVFIGLPDGKVPARGAQGFNAAAIKLRECLEPYKPNTFFIPWRRDPHCDHQASAEIARQAAAGLPCAARILEYPVWARVNHAEGSGPRHEEVMAWRIDIGGVADKKLAAIQSHRSQLGKVVQDDPDGFRLEPHMLVPFLAPYEVYLEASER